MLLPFPLAAQDDAAAYLEMYRQPDNSCQKLNRGKAITLRNSHAERDIEYRLTRTLNGVRQGSFSDGVIAPSVDSTEDNSNDHKLGCENIEGLEQAWQVIRARFKD